MEKPVTYFEKAGTDNNAARLEVAKPYLR